MELYNEISKSFPKIKKLFTETALNEFIDCRRSKIYSVYSGLALWIKDNLLKSGDTLFKIFCYFGFTDKNDMESLMLYLFYNFMREKVNNIFI